MRAREVNQRIEKLGGVAIRQRGSHRLYRATGEDSGISAQTVVPQHPGDIAAGTLRHIENDLKPVFGEGWLR